MIVSLGLSCTLCVLFIGFLFKYWRRSTLPGPPSLPFFGIALTLWRKTAKDILPQFKEWIDLFGGIHKVEVLGMIYVILSEPEVVEPVLSSSTHITKGYFEYSFFRPWLNEGLLLSGGEKWRVRRKLLTPSFHFKILETSLESMCRNAEAFVSSLLATGGKPTEIQEIIRSSTLKIICETAMGVKLNAEDKQQNEFISATKTVIDGIVQRYLHFWLFPNFTYRLSKPGKMFFKGIDVLHTFAEQVIRKRKELFISEKLASGNNNTSRKIQRKAFLDTLLELDDSNPGLFTEVDIREEVDTFMFEGHDTVSAALMFALFLLANHPNVQDKAYIEQIEIFGDDKKVPTAHDLQKMIYLEMIIKETLRLYPSVPFHSRVLTDDLKIDENTVIPAGQSVVILTYYIHRSKRHWINPEEFIPERFTPGVERHPFSYIPFSAGPRNCIGQKFAMMELKTVLSSVVRYCWLEPVTTSIIPDGTVIMKSAEPVIVKVFPRNKTQTTCS
ncbi:cytochrome P450 4C1-like [Halyomorpha halys]|uniref:cytochrome P450 4C1-like n=1 Tax=Halyomorpha halys TaxID=286706 RepID=UPI000D52B0E4|nr:cytochrome P450 4C1-like [Halyomorpha halys]